MRTIKVLFIFVFNVVNYKFLFENKYFRYKNILRYNFFKLINIKPTYGFWFMQA